MTIEEKRAELESNGYTLDDYRKQIVSPDGWTIVQVLEYDYTYAIEKAYAHLQKERELAALREFALRVAPFADDRLPAVKMIANKAQTIIEQFNITEPDDISDATQDRLASVYPDESDTE